MSLLSLVIHLFFYFGMTIIQPQRSSSSDQVEVEYIDNKEKTIVTETELEDLKNEVSELEKKASLVHSDLRERDKCARMLEQCDCWLRASL